MDHFAVFAQLTAERPYYLQWVPFSQKLPLPVGDLDPIYNLFPWAVGPVRTHNQWRSRTFGRLVRWSNLPPYCLRFWKTDGIACLKSRVLMPKVTGSIYSILVSS